MPEKKTRAVAQKAKRQGKSPSTQAGAYVHEEIEHIREGKHGAKNTKQAIAIGLSKARRDGVAIPYKGGRKKITKKTSHHTESHPSRTRSQAATQRLKKEPHSATSHLSLSRQARAAAKKRTAAEKSASAKKAVRTKGKTGLKRAARKAAHTRSAA